MKTFIFISVASLVIFFNHSLAQWEELGPKNGLPDIGSTSYFGITIDGKNIITNTFDELFVSSNNGDSWIQTKYINHSNLIYINGLKDSSIFIKESNKLYISRDLGETWSSSDNISNKTGPIIWIGETGFFGSCCEVYKTLDYGESFVRTYVTDKITDEGYSPILYNLGSLFAHRVIGYRIYRSKDFGSKWDLVYRNDVHRFGNFLSFGNHIIAFSRNESYVLKSTDNGSSWYELLNYTTFTHFQSIISCGSILYAIGNVTQGVFISRDTGQTWTSFNEGLRLNGDYQGVHLAHDDKYLYATFLGNGGGGGLYRAKMKDCEIDFSSDVAEQQESENVNIYPNPVTDFIEISIINPMLKHGVEYSDIKIYNVFGQIQTTPSLRDTPPWKGGEKVRIDVSGLAPGMYFVRIGVTVQKFVKM